MYHNKPLDLWLSQAETYTDGLLLHLDVKEQNTMTGKVTGQSAGCFTSLKKKKKK